MEYDDSSDSSSNLAEICPRKKRRRCGHRISGFNQRWTGMFPWLHYVENEGMYCQWCKTHSVAGRGRATWISKPCISYREDKIKAHMRSFSHKEASKLQAEAEESA